MTLNHNFVYFSGVGSGIAGNTDIDASLLLIKIKSNNLKTKKNGKNSSRMVNKPNE